jgi:hypothetical protein
MKQQAKFRFFLKIAFVMILLLTLFVFLVTWNRNALFHLDKSESRIPSISSNHSQSIIKVGTEKIHASKNSDNQSETAVLDNAMCAELAKLEDSAENTKNKQIRLIALEEKGDKELARILALAIKSQNIQSKTAALFLDAQMRESRELKSFYELHPQCDSNDICLQAAIELRQSVKFSAMNEIAKLAIYSADPETYALAFHACSGLSESEHGYCKQVSAAQWAQRDPENGSAWLYVATEIAKTSKTIKTDELDTVMFRLSQSKKFDVGLTTISRFQRGPEMQNENLFVRPKLLQLAMDVYVDLQLPAYSGVMSYCQIDVLKDANRRQVCDGIANQLIRDDGSFISVALGVKLGERLAWRPDKMANLREDLDAIRELQRTSFDYSLPQQATDSASRSLQSCLWMVKTFNQVENQLRYGEVHEYRSQMQGQRSTTAELAGRFRAYAKTLRAAKP